MTLKHKNQIHPGKRGKGHRHARITQPQPNPNSFGHHMVALITDSNLEASQLNPMQLGEQIAPMIHKMTNKIKLDPVALSQQIVEVLSAKNGNYAIDPITLGTEYKLLAATPLEASRGTGRREKSRPHPILNLSFKRVKRDIVLGGGG